MARSRIALQRVAFVLMSCFAAGAAPAATGATAPNGFDLAPDSETGWNAFGNDYLAMPSGPQPITNDPAHPYIGNVNARGRQVTERIADITNPILTPWAAARMKAANDAVLKGKVGYTAPATCHPGGVPGFHLFPGEPLYFLETPTAITLLHMRGPEVRHIYMNVPHSKKVKPSWYGESVGHFEGDTLVVDTIGLADKGPIDNWRTPHSDRLHVTERYSLSGDGKLLTVQITLEDPIAFTAPWILMQKYRRTHGEPLTESICAENNTNYFNEDVTPMPQADKPDF